MRKLCTAVLLLFPVITMAATFYGPAPYLSEADSPLAGAFSYFYTETFEDGLVDTPGLMAVGGIVAAPSALTDSVDGDDGTIDGSGIAGHSYFSRGVASEFIFSFDASVLGTWPTHAGVAWTDVGQATPDLGFGNVTFEAFAPDGTSLGTLGPVLLGDGSAAGGTAEDRFFGVEDAGGIGHIAIRMDNSTDWEVDHVQYGYVPEPAAIALLALLLVWRRR